MATMTRLSRSASNVKSRMRDLRWPLITAASVVTLAGAGVLSVSGNAFAAPRLPPGTLPIPAAGFVSSGSIAGNSPRTSGNIMTIEQLSQRAIVNWNSFNIGSNAAVVFSQPNASAAILNRIGGMDPSVIQGSILANGQVFLINQNGILFDRGAQINVGSLIASSLGIADSVFNTGLLSLGANQASSAVFSFDGNADAFRSSFIRVESGAQLSTTNGGRIYLFAPRVENLGSISTPGGQTVLAAGAKVYVAAPTDANLRGLLVEVDPFVDPSTGAVLSGVVSNERRELRVGSTFNGQTVTAEAGERTRPSGDGATIVEKVGQIVAERGNVSLVGLAVNQNGRVRATTTVAENGSIFLRARDTNGPFNPPGTVGTTAQVPFGTRNGQLIVGADSVTEVAPDLSSTQTSTRAQSFQPSQIELSGETITIRENARIAAPGGTVQLSAQTTFDPISNIALPSPRARVYIERGAAIDVGGLRDVVKPMESNVIEVELRGTQLADSPLLRASFLRGQKVRIDARIGTPLANIQGDLDQVPVTIAERVTSAGRIQISSGGDIVVREGATLDASGGSIRYADGFIRTTRLLEGGRIVDIGQATADRGYTGFADQFVVVNPRGGPREVYESATRGRFEPGYVEGRAAGSVTLLAPSIVLDGTLRTERVVGVSQRETSPSSGALTIGSVANLASELLNPSGIDFLPRASINRLPGEFTETSALPEERRADVQVPIEWTGANGVGRVSAISNGLTRLGDGRNLALGPRGQVTLSGRAVEVLGSISAPGGSIVVSSRKPANEPVVSPDRQRYRLTIGANAILDVAGLWTNDSPLVNRSIPRSLVAPNAGSVTLSGFADVNVAAGSAMDISGGGWLQQSGTVVRGAAGQLNLSSGVFDAVAALPTTRIDFNGELRATAIGLGGSVAVTTSRLHVGASAPTGAAPETVVLSESFFAQSGVRNYALTSAGDLTIADGATIAPAMVSRTLTPNFQLVPSGASLDAYSRVNAATDVAPAQRQPSTLTFSAGSESTLSVGRGARIDAGAGGEIRLTGSALMTIDGALIARGGGVQLSQGRDATALGLSLSQSIWLGDQAKIDVSGIWLPAFDRPGFRSGPVLSGGNVRIDAGDGWIVTRPGSIIDAAGTAAALDIATSTGIRVSNVIETPGGSVTLTARGGMVLSGGIAAARGGTSVAGGSLSVILNPGRGESAGGSLGERFIDNLPRRITIAPIAASVPTGLNAGDDLGTVTRGRATVGADRVNNGGFDRLLVQSADEIRATGTTDINSRISAALDAPLLGADASARMTLRAESIQIGNSSGVVAPATSVFGSGSIVFEAGTIDVVGSITTTSLADLRLTARDDIRLTGTPVNSGGQTGDGAPTDALRGAIRSAGDITFSAAQSYVSSFSDVTIVSSGGRVAFAGNGNNASPVMSAAGRLLVTARAIDQSGVVKAPLGSITLDASDRLTLAAGSLTSVAADATATLFGVTDLGGQQYGYRVGSTLVPVTAERLTKTINLRGAAVEAQAGSRLDVSGGGIAFAYEWIPGPGGSRDVLAAATSLNTFAVLPGLAGSGPVDHQLSQGASLAAGDRVRIDSPAAGLAAGTYLLLPARYALLPGAYLVTLTPGSSALASGQVRPQLGGDTLTTAARVATGNDGATIVQGPLQTISVRIGSFARQQSEYLQTSAAQFYAASAGTLIADAGALAIAARGATGITNEATLNLQGTLASAPAAGGRGARVDVTAPRLAVTAGGAPEAGFATLDATVLNGLGASSILIGGTRTQSTDTTQISVTADQVRIGASTPVNLSTPEVIVAARDSATISSGSRIIAAGGIAPTTRIAITDANGDGALLAASTSTQLSVARTGNVSGARGSITVAPGAEVSGRSLVVDSTGRSGVGTRLEGALTAGDGGSIQFGAGRISIGETSNVASGLVLSNERLAGFAQSREVTIRSYSALDVYGAANFGSSSVERLTIESGAIAGYGNSGREAIVQARNVVLGNPTNASFVVAPAGSNGIIPTLGNGVLTVRAETLTLTTGPVQTRGFATILLDGASETRTTGTGGLNVAGDITMRTPRIAVQADANYSIEASGALSTRAPISTASASQVSNADALGGRISLTGARIEHATALIAPSGRITLSANGVSSADGVTMRAGSRLDAGSRDIRFGDQTVSSPGGEVNLRATTGNIVAESGSTISVSGGVTSPAGRIDVEARQGNVALAGQVLGSAGPQQRGGSFTSDSRTIDFAGVNAALNDGSLFDQRDIRVRAGDIVVGTDLSVRGRSINLTADAGRIDIFGILRGESVAGRTSGDTASTTVLSGRNGVTLHAGSSIVARSIAPSKAQISTDGGTIDLRAGSSIDLGGETRGGQLTLRAPRSATDVAVTGVRSTISGVESIVVEPVRVYSSVGDIIINTSSLSTYRTDTQTYMGAAGAAIASRLGFNGDSRFSVSPGIEVRSTGGNITLANDWNFRDTASGGWRYANAPGALVLRAAGNLTINANLNDGFATVARDAALVAGPSWSYRLIAGADVTSADITARNVGGVGNVIIGADRAVRTGTGDITIAAGADVRFTNATNSGNTGSVVYTAGVPSVLPSGSLPFTGPAALPRPTYAESGGDVRILAGGNIFGATPTFNSAQAVNNWLISSGEVNAQGVITQSPGWGVAHANFRQGVGALGGGDVEVRARGSIDNFVAVAPTNGRLLGVRNADQADVRNLVIRGGGDIRVAADGNLNGGMFYSGRALVELNAGGVIATASEGGAARSAPRVGIGGDGRVEMVARNGIQIESVFDPISTEVRQFYTYGPAASTSITTTTGDVIFNLQPLGSSGTAVNPQSLVFPSRLTVRALGGDVIVRNRQMVLYPSALGQLELFARDDVLFQQSGSIALSDIDRASLASAATVGRPGVSVRVPTSGPSSHAAIPVHQTSSEPVRITTLEGDIAGEPGTVNLNSAKAIAISAGRDVRDLGINSQNLRAGDITTIRANRDVIYTAARNANGTVAGSNSAITVGGPGSLVIDAGRDVDLGSSIGIRTRGNLDNPSLTDIGANVSISTGNAGRPDVDAFLQRYVVDASGQVVGYDNSLAVFVRAVTGNQNLTTAQAAAEFGRFSAAQRTRFAENVLFAELEAAGIGADGGANISSYERGYRAINTLYPERAGNPDAYKGDLKLFFSAIKTEQGGDIVMRVPGGAVNAGLASVTGISKPASDLGILSLGGGSILGFTRGDFQVNASRVFTVLGGGISLWSSEGNIDAGRGAKTASATPPPSLRITPDGQVALEITNTVAGSGIGVLLGRPNIVPGTVNLFAPRGTVDAGDAGIRAAGNLNIAAVRVVGADNIQFGGLATGTPAAPAPATIAPPPPPVGRAGDAVASAVTASSADQQRASEETRRALEQRLRTSFLSWEVVGFGDEEEQRRRALQRQLQQAPARP